MTFDEEEGVLVIALAGRRSYAYSGVPRAIYDSLCKAASPGGFYNQHIKGRFACRDLSPRRRFRPVEA